MASFSNIRIPAALALALALTACFDSDELSATEETTDTAAEGEDETVTPYDDATGDENDDDWTAEGTGPDETTCRDAIECIVDCQAAFIFNPQPEPDLSCFLECDQGLNIEEAYLLIKLAECIGLQCTEEGKCGGDSSDNDCLTCIAAYANDPQPQYCAEEAAACQ